MGSSNAQHAFLTEATIAETEEEEEEEGDEEEGKEASKVKETLWDWELLNDAKPIWLRSPSDVSEEEYSNFYHAISKVCPINGLANHLTFFYYLLEWMQVSLV